MMVSEVYHVRCGVPKQHQVIALWIYCCFKG